MMLRVLTEDLKDSVIFHVIDDFFFKLRKIPSMFYVDIFIRSVSGMGGQDGGAWRTLRVPDQRLGGHGHS